MVKEDGLTYSCVHSSKDGGKCLASDHGEDCSQALSAPPPPPTVCDRVASGELVDLSELSPPERCYSSGTRRKSKKECEAAAMMKEDGLTYPCMHTGKNKGTCSASGDGEKCSKAVSAPPPPPVCVTPGSPAIGVVPALPL